jgi:nucleoside-diphosphate-sugar epimerase
MNSTGADKREFHVIVVAGPIGSGVARLLAQPGDRVVLVNRSGSGPAINGVERVAGEAADADAMATLGRGAAAIYNCANPPYHRWPTDWPPIASSLLAAAERSGAVLVTVSNLYAYGPARASLGVDAYDEDHPMTEETPLTAKGRKGGVRRQMWQDALAAHEAGRIRAVEIRSSDYVGPAAESALGERVVPNILAGTGALVLGRTDRLHTWTFTEDVARMAVVAASDPRAWGRAWHTPSNAPRTQQQAVDDLARVAGVPSIRLRSVPGLVRRGMGLFSPLMRELGETEYQFHNAFVMDSSAARTTFGLEPTAWDVVLAETLHSYGWPYAARLAPDGTASAAVRSSAR